MKRLGKEKAISKNLSKYIPAFDYFDKTLIVLSATSGKIRIISFTSVTGVPVGIASEYFSLIFSLTTEIIKKLVLKLNSIETLKSQALVDLEITHKEFKTIVNEKERYEQIKETVRNIKSNDELNERSKNIKKIARMDRILKKWETNSIEVIVPYGIKWLNEKNIEEELEHATLPVLRRKYLSKYRKP